MIKRTLFAAALAAAVATAGRAQSFQIDGSFPYAFHGWNTVGYCADAGYLFGGNNFVGLEWTYFNPKPISNYPTVGALRVSQRFEAVQLLDRYSFTLIRLGLPGAGIPLRVYVGAGAGLGRVKQELPASAAATSAYGNQLNAANTELTAEVLAGVELDLASAFAVRAGYRYVDTFNNVRQFGAGVNTDTKALEVGASLRF